MFDVILSLSLSFAITFLSIPVIIRVADMKKLFDVPNARKVHVTPIPSLGGLGIFAGFVLAILLSLPAGASQEFQYFLAAGFIIFFLGLKDDILVLSPVKKLIGQLMAAFIMVYKGGLQIKSMHGFLGIYEMPEMFSLALTYFTILVIVNSFNLIDGVDGLAGSLAVLACSLFGLYFISARLTDYAILAFAFSGSMLAFLIFNFSPSRIFMGDTGSLLAGLVTAILVIKFINIAEGTSVLSSGFSVAAAPAVGFSVLLVPLLDTLRVFSIRMLNRRSPFSPDRNHVHHMLLDWGFSHKNITFILVATNIAFIAFALFAGKYLGCTMVITTMVVVAYSLFAVAWYRRPSRRTKIYVPVSTVPAGAIEEKEEKAVSIIGNTNIFTITKEKLQ